MSAVNPTPRPEFEPAETPAEAVRETPLCGLIVVDAGRCVVAVDPDVELLLGVAARELTGHPLRRLPAAIAGPVARVLEGGAPVREEEIQLTAGDATPHTVSMSIRSLAPGGTGGSLAIVTLLDVTAIRELEANTHRLERLASIGTLSASMAHEVKNALVAVKTFVELLITKNQDAALTDIVGREMKRIDSIVSQMLRFGGPARPTLGTVHLHQVLDQSLNLVQHHLEGRKIKLLRSLNASPDTVRGDSYQLEQAFINLFFNALDAMGADGVLHVSTEFVPAGSSATNPSPVVQVVVQDNGIGIPADNLSRLFEPFFTTKPNGTGLGLPITRRIIEEHRGSIVVTSEPHQGTRFVLSLPSIAAHQP